MSRCAGVPFIIVTTTSRPCMMWTDSSQQIFFIVRLYGPYDDSRSACWATIAAASTSHAMMPTSPHDFVG